MLNIVCRSTPKLALRPLGPKDASAAAVDSESTLELQDVLASACELANIRASKVLAVRSEQHAELALSEFVEIFLDAM